MSPERVREIADLYLPAGHLYRDTLEAAITVALSEAPSGWVTVPREPSGAMIEAGDRADSDYSNNRFDGHGHFNRTEFIYRAMLSAIEAAPGEK